MGEGRRPGERSGGPHGRGRRHRQGFSKGQAARRSSGPRPARQQSRRAPRAARPTREAGQAWAPSAPRPSPDPRPRGRPAAESGDGSDRAAGSNWCLPRAQLRPSREQKPPPALKLPAGGPRGGAALAPGSQAPEVGHPQGAPPNFPPLQSGSGEVSGWFCRANGERSEQARGLRPGGVHPRETGRPQGDQGPSEVKGARARPSQGRGGKSASWKLTAVVGLVAVGVRLVLRRLGGRPCRAVAGARARTGAVGSEELVDILVVVAGAVGGAAAAGASRGRASGGVRGRSGAGPRGLGQAPREAGEVVGDLLDGPDRAGAHVDSHMLLDADGRLLPAPPEGHAGSAAPPGRGPAWLGAAPARGRLSEPGGARRGLRASPAAPPDGPDAATACSAAAGASECRGWQAGGGPSSRHPVATKQCEGAGCAGGRGAERAAPSGAALTGTHTGAHAGPGPRACTHWRAGQLEAFHSRALEGRAESRAGTRGRTLAHFRAYCHLLGSVCSHRPHAGVQEHFKHTHMCALGRSAHWLTPAGHHKYMYRQSRLRLLRFTSSHA